MAHFVVGTKISRVDAVNVASAAIPIHGGMRLRSKFLDALVEKNQNGKTGQSVTLKLHVENARMGIVTGIASDCLVSPDTLVELKNVGKTT